MKKLLITILFMLAAIGAYGQNKFKYPINANGGLRVGGDDHDLIDSVKIVTGTITIYIGGVGYSASVDTTSLSDRINLKLNISDTSDMLNPYALLSEVGTGDISASDTSDMLTPYIREAEVSSTYSNKALSNLSSVAINTHLLPGTDGAVNLGSAAKQFGDVKLDSAKSITWNGTESITHSDGTLTVAADLALGSNNLSLTGSISTPATIAASGLVSTGAIRVGTSDTGSNVDSLKVSGTTVGAWDGATQLSWDFPAEDEGELGDYAILLGDTLYSQNPAVYTQRQVDSLVAGLGSGSGDVSLADTVHLHTFNTGYNTAHDTMFFEAGSILGAYHTRGKDTTVVTHVISQISNDDSLTFCILYADTINAVVPTYVTDTIVLNDNGTVETITFENDTIPPDKWVYAKVIATPDNKNPIFFASTMIGSKVKGTFDSDLVDFYAEFDTIYDSFVTKPELSDALKMNSLVYSLDTAGYFDRMDVLYIFANHDSAEAYTNWIKPGTRDANPASTFPDWAQWYGFTGTNNDVISTNYVPSTDSVLITPTGGYGKNDASAGIYIINEVFTGADYYSFGSYDYNFYNLQFAKTSAIASQWRINSGSATYEGSAIDAQNGMFIVSRTAPDACALYQNGASKEAVADASLGLPTNEIRVLGGRSPNYTTDQVAIFFLMDATANATEAAELTDIFETYMDAIGTGIIAP